MAALSLASLSVPAHAGSYTGPVYTGGNAYQAAYTGHPVVPYAIGTSTFQGGSYGGYGGDAGGTVNASCTGTITATFTWQTAPGQTLLTDPPPPIVILRETCTAAAYGVSIPAATVGGSCDNGLGVSQASLTQIPSTYGSPPVVYGMTGTGLDTSTRYQAIPGTPTITLTRTPGASVTCLDGTTVCLRYSASLSIPPLQGHSTVDTANWNPTYPRFFSGTNCTVAGTALAYSAPPGNASYPLGGSYVTQATLTLGGTVVKSYYDATIAGPYPTGAVIDTNQSSVSLSVVFDSTHFADGSSILAQLTVTDSGGFTYTVPIQANAYNKAAIYGRNEWETGNAASYDAGTPYAKSNLALMNHNTSIVNITKGWTAANILQDIGTCTAFYVNTHGDFRPTFRSDLDEITASSEYIYPSNKVQSAPANSSQVLETRQNSGVNIPPINIAFIDSCETGKSSGFGDTFLWPNTSTSSTDQAEAGWTILASTYTVYNECPAFWNTLAQGETIIQARDATVKAYFAALGQNIPVNTKTSDYLMVYGDQNARLHAVYTGDNNAPVAAIWYK